jgi:hypothetical protein
MTVTMKNAVFWDVAPCTSCISRRFEGTYRLHLQSRKIRQRGTSVSRWLQSVLDGGEWSVSRSGPLPPLQETLALHWVRGWVGRSHSRRCEKEKIILPLSGIEHRFLDRPAHSLVAISIESYPGSFSSWHRFVK